MSAQDKEQSLREWVSSHGGYIHPDLSLFTDDAVKGRSVTATKHISKGTLLMKVPISICLVASPTKPVSRGAPAEGVGPSLAGFLSGQRRLTPFLRLVLLILHEYSEGAASSMLPFIESLPPTHNCVLGWNSAEKSLLAGTTIEAEAATDIKATFDSIVLPIIRDRPETWKGECSTFEAFQRVCGVVQSRTFHLQEDNWLTGASTEGTDLWMLPAIDMVNHSTEVTARNTSLQRKELPTEGAEPMATDPPAKDTPALQLPPPAAEPTATQPPTEAAPADEAPTEEAPTEAAQAEGAQGEGAVVEAAPVEAPATEVTPAEAPAAEIASASMQPAAVAENGVTTTPFFTMEADADIVSSGELLHSYGDLSDAELLNIFGFIDSLGADFTNPNNEVHLPTETLVALCQEQKSGRRLGKNFKRRKDFLKDNDMLPVGFPVTLQDPIPDSLITVTQILLMSDMGEFDDLRLEILKEKKKNGNTAVLGKETLDDSEQSMFVCTNLLRTVDEQIASFPEVPTTVDGASPVRAAQAAHVRAGEKAIVQRQKKELLALMMTLGSEGEEDDEEY